MKVRHIVLVFLVLILLFSCRDAEDDPQEFYLEGTVTDPEGNTITGAEVFLQFNFPSGKNNGGTKDPTQVSSIFFEIMGSSMIFHWTTTFELNLTQFNILRGIPTNHYAINPTPIIPSNNPSGSSYTYTHNTVLTDFFWLEARDSYGMDQYLGPFVQYVPIEISSFTATLDAQHHVLLNWTSESESNLLGYVLLRGECADVMESFPCSPMINATNTSIQQHYSFTDTSVTVDQTYYYWLQGVSTFGGTDHWGPISISVTPLFPPVLSSFTVQQSPEHHALLSWTSVSETDLTGWYVYRGSEPDMGTADRISPLINAFNESTPHTYNFTDTEVEYGESYYYWLHCMGMEGESSSFGPEFLQIDPYVPPILPTEFAIGNPYPSPAVNFISLQCAVPDSHYATVVISRAGVQCALREYTLLPGNHTITWDCTDQEGIKQSNGCYLATATVTHTRTKNRPSQFIRHFVINGCFLDNLPNAYSGNGGYGIFLQDTFLWDQYYIRTNASGTELGECKLPLSVTVYVKKEGYVTATKQVTLLPKQTNILDFVLQPTGKLAQKISH